MKKLVKITSALALIGGASYAAEDAMDEDMMMEVPAPSVTISGSAKMGVENVSTDGNPPTDGMSLIKDYKVSFSSEGTTDGGMIFGAGISIDEDNGGEVNGASVYVGGAGGAWKLTFGAPDPGIYSAGGIGVASEDDLFYATNDHQIEFSGSFEGASYVITSNAPTDDMTPNEWSAGVNYGVGDVNIGVGMDSEKGLALGVSTDVSGVGMGLFYGKAEMATAPDYGTAQTKTASDVEMTGYNTERSGLGVSASIAAGEGATVSVAYSKVKTEHAVAGNPAGELTGNIANRKDGSDEEGTLPLDTETKLIELDFSYDLGGGATLGAGIDQEDNDGKKMTTLEATIAMSF